jgi:galactonate dehydratase
LGIGRGFLIGKRRNLKFVGDFLMKVNTVKVYLTCPGEVKNFVYVKVETDEGISGWGEAYTQLEGERATLDVIERLGRYLVGRDPFGIKHFTQVAYDDFAWRRGSVYLYSAISALEQALWDIVGKSLGQPIYNLLGGPCRTKVRVYANGWHWEARNLNDIAHAAKKVLQAGFTALKIYPTSIVAGSAVGGRRFFASRELLDQAVEVVRSVRSAIGPEVDLLIDGARHLAPMYAVEFAKRIEPFRPYWYEEPCPAENLDALAEIRSHTGIPIVTGESLYSKTEFRHVFEKRAADIINPDVCSVGGILTMMEIASMAEPYYIAVSPHNWNSTVLGTAATVHVSASMPNFLIAEYFVNFVSHGRQIAKQLEPEDGFITIPQAPGLGVEINEKALSRFPQMDFSKRSIPTYEEETV